MTARAVRARHRRLRARRDELDAMFGRNVRWRRALSDAMADDEYLAAVKAKIRQIEWWAPRKARGAKRCR